MTHLRSDVKRSVALRNTRTGFLKLESSVLFRFHELGKNEEGIERNDLRKGQGCTRKDLSFTDL
jgi:hypothetical protein